MKSEKFWLPGIDDTISAPSSWRSKIGRNIGEFTEDVSPLRSTSFFRIVIILIVIVFVGQLFYLMILNGEKNRVLADDNRIQLITEEAKRGKIIGSDGNILAQSRVLYFLTKGDTETLISQSQVQELEKLGLAGFNYEGELGKISKVISRKYPLGEASAHVLGYVSRASEEDLKADSTIKNIDWVGKAGVEDSYNSFLMGKNGQRIIEVDAQGRNVAILGDVASVDGRDIKLTIDSGLQKFAYDTLLSHAAKAKSNKGAVIVQKPQTGEILALVSLPSFNPEDIGAYAASGDNPFFNRALQGNYPPGSVFKIITALAGLESKSIDRDTEIEDVGEFYLGDIRFSNWYFTQYGGKDGNVKLEKAIARSNDIYFYRVAERTGLENLRKTAIKFGFGQKTGIDLAAEGFGLVPDGVWKESTLGVGWYPGDTMHLGIGQGFMLVTPMQINNMTNYMAVGRLTKPYLVSEITADKKIEIAPKVVGENLVSRDNFELVRAGMKAACREKGTAWPFFTAPYEVGCKTGTAEQTVGNPNAWFTVFAPFDNPEVAVTVLVEDGGEGSSVAAPVAREILDWYLPRL